ncbi:MAG: hypothetical protein J6B67_04440 [Oscillospiraceae bacterium]|nr:hypothetical protein [Oscillospiraceae bacterium]
MYCISCGVKLAESEKKCPLCGLEVYHPRLPKVAGERMYPAEQYPEQTVSPWGVRMLVLVCFLLPLLIVLLCDLPVHGRITWSGYVIGALVLLYVAAVLPLWFKKPNPVIFVPVDFAAICVYLLYINFAVDGSWFMTFALPVTGFWALTVTAVVTLRRYVRRGRLYVYGGAAMAAGAFFPIMELLLYITFDTIGFLGWSFYPMGVLILFGGFLIFLGICRPAREMMERKFFI